MKHPDIGSRIQRFRHNTLLTPFGKNLIAGTVKSEYKRYQDSQGYNQAEKKKEVG